MLMVLPKFCPSTNGMATSKEMIPLKHNTCVNTIDALEDCNIKVKKTPINTKNTLLKKPNDVSWKEEKTVSTPFKLGTLLISSESPKNNSATPKISSPMYFNLFFPEKISGVPMAKISR